MNITKARLIEIIKEEVIKEAGGVAGNFGGVATELGAQRADGNDLPDHDLYGPQQTAEDNFVGILNEIGHMLDAWEKKKYPSDEARYMSYFEDLQGLLEQYDPCAHVGQKCEDVHPNQSHEECVEVTINNALYEAIRLHRGYQRPAYGAGNLTIQDVEQLLPHLSAGEQTDVWEKYKHLNSIDDLRRALRMNEQET